MAAVFAMLLAAAAFAQAQDARLVMLNGTLTVSRDGGSTRTLSLNDGVQIGDELMTGPDSEAVIETRDGATVRIFPGSRFVLTEPSSGLREFLHLILGSVKVHIEKLSGRPNPHKMTTPTAVIAVRGTTFSVQVGQTGATLVAVDEGEVAVANVAMPEREVIVRRGRRTLVLPGQPPMRAQRFRGASEQAGLAPWRGGGQQPQTPQGMQSPMGAGGADQRGGVAVPGAMRGGRGRWR